MIILVIANPTASDFKSFAYTQFDLNSLNKNDAVNYGRLRNYIVCSVYQISIRRDAHTIRVVKYFSLAKNFYFLDEYELKSEKVEDKKRERNRIQM